MNADELLEEMAVALWRRVHPAHQPWLGATEGQREPYLEDVQAIFRVFVEKTGLDHHTLMGLALVHNLMDDGKHEATCEQLRRAVEANDLLLTLTDKEGK